MSKADQERVRQKVAHTLDKARKANPDKPAGHQQIGNTQSASQRVWHEKGLFWGTAAFWGTCTAVGVGAGLSAVGMVARGFFIAAVPFGLIASWCVFELVSNRWLRLTLRLLSAAACVGLTWLVAAYTIRVPMELTLRQKTDFTAILKSGIAGPPAWTIISCPDNDEQACLFAATFIPLFQRAGWKIDGPNGAPQVERARLTVPQNSISLVAWGPPLVDPQNPDQGVWTAVNPWEQVLKSAFWLAKIYPATQNDPTLPKNKLRVYFGSVPKQ